MRIAFIGARGVVGTYSGIETYYEEVGSRLAEKGHQVTAYCRSYFTPDLELYRGIHIRRLPALRTKHLETISHSLLSTADSLFGSFDIIQFHAIGSAPLALVPRLLGQKTVVSVRGLDWQRAKWGAFAKRALQFGEWASARAPTATAVVSETLKRHYQEAYRVTPEVVPNAISVQSDRPIERLESFGIGKDDYFLFAGRISPEKGVHHLLEAFAPLSSERKLIIAGGSSYSDRYVEEVKRMAWEDVLFLGRVDRGFMEELLSNCLAFVLPSAMEGLSVALLEALSYGSCIVASDIPENREVAGDVGLYFPFGDVQALRAQLKRIIDEPQLVLTMRERALSRASSLPDWDEVAARTEEFYQRLLGPN